MGRQFYEQFPFVRDLQVLQTRLSATYQGADIAADNPLELAQVC